LNGICGVSFRGSVLWSPNSQGLLPMFETFQRSMKPMRSLLAMAGLVCLPGCSGCESQTSPAGPPVTSQSESSPAEAEKAADKQGAVPGKASQDGSLTEIRPASGDSDSNESDGTANSEGESNPSSATESSSKPAAGGGTAPKDSGTGSADGESGGSGGGRGSGKAKSSGQTTGKPSSPGEAVATAKTLKERSDKAAAGKEYGQAFELATKAWESVQTFPKDAACQKMSSDLQRRMDELATLANAQRGSDLKRDKPLIVR
jgi:hypothetical protein